MMIEPFFITLNDQRLPPVQPVCSWQRFVATFALNVSNTFNKRVPFSLVWTGLFTYRLQCFIPTKVYKLKEAALLKRTASGDIRTS